MIRKFLGEISNCLRIYRFNHKRNCNISYMANGLRVVTVRIPAVEQSAVSHMVYYYDEQTPQAIATAIMAIDVSKPYDSRKIIGELDLKFRSELDQLLNNERDQ